MEVLSSDGAGLERFDGGVVDAERREGVGCWGSRLERGREKEGIETAEEELDVDVDPRSSGTSDLPFEVPRRRSAWGDRLVESVEGGGGEERRSLDALSFDAVAESAT